MRAHPGTLVAAFVVVGAVAIGVAAWPHDASAGDTKRRRKPAEVNIVQAVPLEVSVSNAPLGVVAELPPVDVKSLPPVTHLGQAVGDHVVLNLVNPTTAPVFVRCNDDGTRDATEFAVPAGSKLVVTDVDWLITADQLVQAATLRLFIENRATPTTRCLAFLQTGPTTNVLNGSGSSAPGFGTTGLQAGFVVGSSARIVADLRSPSEAVNVGTTLAPITYTNATVVVRGYLVKAP